MPPAAALMDDIVEEVFLRFPPDDHKLLLRAALVCKRWARIITDPGFRRRFHGTPPPMLGFLYNLCEFSEFVPTNSFRPPGGARHHGAVVDARHGRVLLHPGPRDWPKHPLDKAFVVWDPMTGERRELPLLPESVRHWDWNAAVLCAAHPGGACDHLVCCGGPFLVIFVATDRGTMFVYAYSSETGAWSEQASAQHPSCRIALLPSALVGTALHFLTWFSKAILKYDLGSRELSVIRMPLAYYFGRIVLMTTEHGGLGFATVVKSKLYLWSREPGSDENSRWVQSRVIKLKKLFPKDVLSASLEVAAFAQGVDIIFVRTYHELFTIDLKTIRVTKVSNDIWLSDIYPYVSFYTPALGVGNRFAMSGTTRGKCLINIT